MPRAQRAWVRRSFLLLVCAWPLALHYAVEFASPAWPARVTAIAVALGTLIWAIADERMPAAITSIAILVFLWAAALHAPALLLFGPPVIINASVASFFGASLMPGREPVTGVIARLEQGGELPPDLARHARAVTWAWTILLATNAILALALSIWAPLETWSLFANVVVYVLIATLFIGEYAYRRARFRHYRHASLWALLLSVRATNLFVRR